MDGWICSYRQMLNNPVVCKDAEYFAVWNFLLLSATHQDYEVYLDGHRFTLKPGQLVTSRRSIADKFSISDSKVERILKAFENEHQIEQLANHRNRLITVVNWEQYQKSEPLTEPQVNQYRTSSEPVVDTNNNINNITTEQHNNIKQQNNVFNGAALSNPFEQVKQEQAKAAGKKARKEQKGTLEELEDSMSRSSASDELKEELRKWWRWRRYDKKIPMGSLAIRNTVAESSQSEVLYGTELTIACFERSMTNDYQGVFFNEKAMRATVKDLKEQGATITYGKGGQPKIDWSSL